LERAVAGIPPFSLAAEGFGAFPCSGKPRVLWVGIGGQVESLLALQRRVESGTSSFGEPPDPRPFHPHISVARVKNATVAEGGRILRCIGGLGEKSAGSWLVDRVELIQSRPSPAGSIYTCLKSIVLAGA
jgi:2'-5' RNA ligase